MDCSKWPRCLLWHGWLPGLSGPGGRTPWAASSGQLACCDLERSLGAYPVDEDAFWTPPDHWDADDSALEVTDAPNVWTDGSREDFSSIGGFEVAGAVVMRSCLSLDKSRRFSVLNFGEPSLLCSRFALAT